MTTETTLAESDTKEQAWVPPAPKPVTLSKPIPYGKTELKELRLRRPVAGDLRGLRLADLEDYKTDFLLAVAERASEQHVTRTQLEALALADLTNLGVEIASMVTGPDDAKDTDDRHTLTLHKPVLLSGTLVTQLQFMEPQAGHLRGIGLNGLITGDVDTLLTVGKRLTIQRLDDGTLWQLDGADLVRLGQRLMGFFAA
ncbi:MAG: hypothetical protein RLY86_119 [Pseudomonadota bacterium]|jgi:hypothetical protein